MAEERECPSGWYPFGTHGGWDGDDMPILEFHDDTDEAGMPLWERPDWNYWKRQVEGFIGAAVEDLGRYHRLRERMVALDAKWYEQLPKGVVLPSESDIMLKRCLYELRAALREASDG